MYSKLISLFNNTRLNGKSFFYLNKSVKYLNFLNLLLRESLIKNYKSVYSSSSCLGGNGLIKVFLIKRNDLFLIKSIKQVSKSNKPVFIKSNKIRLKMDSSSIILTSMGLMFDVKAKKLNLGGKIICTIFF